MREWETESLRLVPTIRRACLASLAVVAASALPAAPAGAGQEASGADRALERAMRGLVRMPAGPPGIAVVVQRGGRAAFHAAGVADVASGDRWRARDHMRIASVSKAFSGAAALGLVSRGRLRVDDRIGSILPWLPPSWKKVTLAQALDHTSGLPDYSASKSFGDYLAKNLHAYLSPRRLVDFVAGDPLVFAPGSRYEYSNTDNVVVGLLVAAVTDGTYSQELRRSVLDPLGLSRTSLPTGFRLPSPHVHGYEVSPTDPPEDVTTLLGMSGAWASGGIQSTSADLNRFIRGYVGRRLFDRATQRLQLTFVKGHSEPPGPGVNSAGLGIFRYRTACGVVYGHTGNLPGYTQFAAASLDGRRSVTVSVNGRVIPDAPTDAVRAAFAALRHAEALAVCAALAGR